MIPRPPRSTRTDTLFPYTTLFRSLCWAGGLIITRQMRGSEGALTILIWSTIAGLVAIAPLGIADWRDPTLRSEEHTSELQSLMRISYAVFCLKKKKKL